MKTAYIIFFQESELIKLQIRIDKGYEKVFQIYNELLRSLERLLLQYLDLSEKRAFTINDKGTKLDKNRVGVCNEEIKDIVDKIRHHKGSSNNNFIKKAMVFAYKCLHRLTMLIEDVSSYGQ